MIFSPLSCAPGGGLRIAAAQVARRQHALRCPRGRAAPAWRGPPGQKRRSSRSPGNRTPRPSPRSVVAGSRMIGTIVASSMSSSARAVFFGRPPGHRLVDEVDHLRLERAACRRVDGGCRVCALHERRAPPELVGEALQRGSRSRSSPPCMSLIVVGSVRVQELHRRPGAGFGAALAQLRAAGCASRSTRRRSRCPPGRATRTCGTRCSGRPRRRTRRSGGSTRRGASAPRRGRPRSAARWRGSCCAGCRAGSRAARASRTPGLHLPQRRQSLNMSAIAPMSLLLEDERLVADEREGRRVGVAQVRARRGACRG